MLMDIFKKVRKSKGWKPYKMAKELRIGQTSLSHYEKQPVSMREMLLVRLQELSGLSVEEFWDLLKEEVAPAEKARIKRLIKDLE